jgi:hypothetical protein
MSDYRVSIPDQEETAKVLARLRAGEPLNKNDRRTAILQGGIELKGSFEITARDAASGEVAWEHKDDNLITDLGRRYWMDVCFNSVRLGFAASTESPSAARSSISGDTLQIFGSGTLSPTNNTLTHTKTVSTTFTTPANNRTLGTVFLTRSAESAIATVGMRGIVAYALLTPPKTQTTVQTLEVVYKISMSPIS